MNKYFIVAGLLTLFFLQACSSLIAYKNSAPVNLKIIKQTDSDIRTQIHIYDVSQNCQLDYVGTVNMNTDMTEIGVNVNKLSFVEVQFSSSSFFSGDRSTTYGSLLTPSKNYKYELNANYIDNIYNVTFFKNKLKSNNKMEIDPMGLESCHAK